MTIANYNLPDTSFDKMASFASSLVPAALCGESAIRWEEI